MKEALVLLVLLGYGLHLKLSLRLHEIGKLGIGRIQPYRKGSQGSQPHRVNGLDKEDRLLGAGRDEFGQSTQMKSVFLDSCQAETLGRSHKHLMSELLYVTKALSSGYKHPSGSEVSILVESTKDRGEAPHLWDPDLPWL